MNPFTFPRAASRHRMPGWRQGARGLVLAAAVLAAASAQSTPVAIPDPADDVCTSPPAVSAAAADAVSVQVRLPEAALRPARGAPQPLTQRVRVADAVLLNFIYTSCTSICPPMTQIFAATQERLGTQAQRIQMISVSIDPEHDTPRRLRSYLERFGAGPQWSFYTGAPRDIDAVQNAFSVWRPDKMGHTPVTFIKPAGRTQWLRLDGLASAEQLIALALPSSPR